jgi:hypothetical protein
VDSLGSQARQAARLFHFFSLSFFAFPFGFISAACVLCVRTLQGLETLGRGGEGMGRMGLRRRALSGCIRESDMGKE